MRKSTRIEPTSSNYDEVPKGENTKKPNPKLIIGSKEKIVPSGDDTNNLSLDDAFVEASKLQDAKSSKASIENLYKIYVKNDTAISKETLLEAIKESTKLGHAEIANILLGNAPTNEGTLIEPETPFETGDLLTILEEAVKQEDGKDKTAIIGYLAAKDVDIKTDAKFKEYFTEAAKSGHVATVEALYAASLEAERSSINADEFLAAAKGAISDAPEETKLAVTKALIGHLSKETADDKVVLNPDQLSEILTAAAESGNVAVIDAFYNASLDSATPSTLTADHLKAAIKAAAKSGKDGAVTALLEKANATGVAVDGKITIDEGELNTALNESFTEAVKSGNQATVAAVYARSIRYAANDEDIASTITEETLLGSLKEASKAENNDIVKYIISHVSLDADDNGKVNVAQTAFNEALGVSFALAASEGKTAVFDTLLDGRRKDVLTLDAGSMDADGLKALDDAKKSKVLLAAAENGVEAVVTTLLTKYPTLDASAALLAASLKDNVAITTALANHAAVSIDGKDASKNTALYNCIKNQLEIADGVALPAHIAALLSKDANLLTICENGDTPLIQALKANKPNLAKAMINLNPNNKSKLEAAAKKYESSKNEFEANKALNKSFAEAVKSGNQATVAAVYARSIRNAANDADVPSTITEETLLGSLKEASKAGNNVIVTAVIANANLTAGAVVGKVAVNAGNFNEALGVSFALAASEEKTAVFGTLLADGRKDVLTLSNTSVVDANGLSDSTKQTKVLLAASENGVRSVVTTLLAKYPTLDASKALLAASLKDNVAITTALANHAAVSIDGKDASENTALYNCIKNQVDVDPLPDHIEALLSKDANLLTICENGDTPLIKALREAKPNLAKAMITLALTKNPANKADLEAAKTALGEEALTKDYVETHDSTKDKAEKKSDLSAAREAEKKRGFNFTTPESLKKIQASNTAATESLTKLLSNLGTDPITSGTESFQVIHVKAGLTNSESYTVKEGTETIAQLFVGKGTSTFYLNGNTAKTDKIDLAEDNADDFITKLQPVYKAKKQQNLLAAVSEGQAAVEKVLKDYVSEKKGFGIKISEALDLADALVAAATAGDTDIVNNLYTKSLSKVSPSLIAKDKFLEAVKTTSENGHKAAVIGLLSKVSVGANVPDLVEIAAADLTDSLVAAAGAGKADIVTLLAEKDPTVRNKEAFKDAFVAAATNGDAATVEALYKASIEGLNPSTIDAETLSQALTAASIAGHVDAVNLLLGNANSTGATIAVNPELTADLLIAAFIETAKVESSAEIIPLLVAKDVAILGNTLKDQKDFSKAFTEAFRAENKEVVNAIFKSYSSDTDAKTFLDKTYLLEGIKVASESRNSYDLKDLLGKISSPADESGKVTLTKEELKTLVNDAFLEASKTGSQDSVEALFDISVRSTTSTLDADQVSSITEETLLKSLKEASKQGHADVIDLFISKTKSVGNVGDFNISIAALNKAIGVSFVLAAANDKSKAITSLLAGKNSDADKAAALGTVKLETTDIENTDNGIDNLIENQQSKVLLAAAENGVRSVVTTLLAKYPTLDASKALLAASLKDNVAITTALANHAAVSIDGKGTSENTALYNCIKNQLEIADAAPLPAHIEALLSKDANLLTICENGDTPLIQALKANKPNLAKAMTTLALTKNPANKADLEAAKTALGEEALTKDYVETHDSTKDKAEKKSDLSAAREAEKKRGFNFTTPESLKKIQASNTAATESLTKLLSNLGTDPITSGTESFQVIHVKAGLTNSESYTVKEGTETIAQLFVGKGTSTFYLNGNTAKTDKIDLAEDNADDFITKLQPVYKAKKQQNLLAAVSEGQAAVEKVLKDYVSEKKGFGIKISEALDLADALVAAATAGDTDIVNNLYTKSLSKVSPSLIAKDKFLEAVKTTSENGHKAAVIGLLSKVSVGANVPDLVEIAAADLTDSLVAAAGAGKADIVTLLAEKDPTVRNKEAFKDAFVAAATNGDAATVEALYKASIEGLNPSTIDAETLSQALTAASIAGHVDAVNLLLGNANSTGATIAVNPELTADLLIAAFIETAKVESSAEIIPLLVAKDVAILGNTLKDQKDFSKAFTEAFRAENKEVVNAIFKSYSSDTDAKTFLDKTYLLEGIKVASESRNSYDLKDLLGKISSPADESGKVTLTKEELKTLVNDAFLEASKTGSQDSVEALFDISVRSTTSTLDADQVSSITEETLLKSLKEASKQGHADVIDLFISKTKSVGNVGDFNISIAALNKAIGVSFVLAAANDKSKAITSLLAGKNSDADKAAALGTVKLETTDIENTDNGIDNLIENQQSKVLLAASANGLNQIITPLLTKYAATIRIDEKDDQENTTLYNSIAGQTADITSADLALIPEHIKALIENGADLNASCENFDTPIVKAIADGKLKLATAMVAKAIERERSADGKSSNKDLEAARLALMDGTSKAYVDKFGEKTAPKLKEAERNLLATQVQPSKSLFTSEPKKALNKFDQVESAKIKELFSLITKEGSNLAPYKITQGPTSMGGTIYKVNSGLSEILRFTIPGSSSQAHFSTNGGTTKTPLTPANENDVIKILEPIYKEDAQNNLLIAATKKGGRLTSVKEIFDNYQTNKKKFGIEANDNLDLNSAFTEACEAGHLDIAKYLYEQSVSTNKGVVTSSITDKSLLQAIEQAASEGRFDMIEVLIGNKIVSEKKTVEEAGGGTKYIEEKAVLGFEKITQSQILEFIKNAATKGGNDEDRSKIIAALYDKFDSATKDTTELTQGKISEALSESLLAAAIAGNSNVVKLLLGESEVASGKKVEATYTSKSLSQFILRASKVGHASVAESLLDKLSTIDPTPAGKVDISSKDLSETLSKSFVNAAANSREAAVNALALRMNDARLDIKIDEATLTEIKASATKTQILANVLEASAAKEFRQIVTAVATASEMGSVDAKAKDGKGRPIKQTPLYNCVENLASDISDSANLPPEIEALIAKGADIFAVCKINDGQYELTDSNTPINRAIEGGKSNLAAKMVARAREVKIEALRKSKGLDAGATIELSEDDRIAFDNAANAALDNKATSAVTKEAVKAFKVDHAARVNVNDADILKTTTKSEPKSTADTLTPGIFRTKTLAERDLKKVTTKSNDAIIGRLHACFTAIGSSPSSYIKFPATDTGAESSGKPKFSITHTKAGTLSSESYVIRDLEGKKSTTITLNKEDGYLVGEGIVVSDAKGTRKLDEKSVSNFIRGLKDIYIAKKQDELLEAASHKNPTALFAVLDGFNSNKKQFEIREETQLDLREAYLVAKVNGSVAVISILEAEPFKLTEEKVFGKESEGGLGETKISSYLPVAAKNKQYDLLERLSGMGAGNSDMADSSGNTAIYYLLSEKISDTATQKKVNELTKHLLLSSTDVNFKCHDGNTVLHAAIMSENYEVAPRIITMMIGKNMDLNIRNNSGETAFDLIAKIPDKAFREDLLDRAADAIHKAPNLDRGLDLLEASRTGHPELLTYLAGKYRDGISTIHVRDANNNNTPLHYISSQTSSNPEKSKAIGLATHALLEKGAQPFFKGKEDNTALHLALKSENYVLAALMISKVNALGEGDAYNSLGHFEEIKNDRNETVNDLVGKIKDPKIKAELQSLISEKKVMSSDEVKALVGTIPEVKAKGKGTEVLDRALLRSNAVGAFSLPGKKPVETPGGNPAKNKEAEKNKGTSLPPATSVPNGLDKKNSPPPKSNKPLSTASAANSQEANRKALKDSAISSADLKAAIEALSKDSTQKILKGSSGAEFTAEEAVKIKLSSSGTDLQLSVEALKLATKGIINKAAVAARNEADEKLVEKNKIFDQNVSDRFVRTKYNGIDFTDSKNNSFANCEFSGACTFGNIGGNGNKFVNCTFGDDCIPTLPIVAGQFKAENFSQCKFTKGFLDKLVAPQKDDFMKALKLDGLTPSAEGVYTSMTTAEARGTNLLPAAVSKATGKPSTKARQPIESFRLLETIELGRGEI